MQGLVATMPIQDRAVSIHPYFKAADGKLDDFRKLCERFIAATEHEPKCIYYGFSFDGQNVHCREAYEDADGLLTHLANVDALLKEALTISDLARLEIHGPAEELDKLREPLFALGATYFTLENGIRRA